MSHDPFHRASWRAFRLGALLIGSPIAVLAILATGLLLRLSQGPLEVTRIAAHWTPIGIQASETPGHPAGRLDWQRVFVAWHRGAALGLFVEAHDLRILRQDGSSTLQLDDAQMVLSIPALLTGNFHPKTITAHNGQVTLRRHANGDVDFDWPGARSRPGAPSSFSVADLRHIDISGVKATLIDAAHQQSLVLKRIDARLSRDPRFAHHLLWSGNLRAELQAQGNATTFTADGNLDPRGTRWHFHLNPIEPTALSLLVPSLARWHAPLSLDMTALIGQGRLSGVIGRRFGLALLNANGAANLGAGQILQDDAPPLSVKNGEAEITLAPTRPGQRNVELNIPRASLVLLDDKFKETRFSAGASFTLSDLFKPRRIDGSAHAEATDLNMPDLSAIWPVNIMKGARRWVTRNLTSGQGRGLAAQAVLHSDTGWKGIQPTGMHGGLHVEHATVNWLRPVVPAQDVFADLSFDNADTLRIDFLHGVQPSDDAASAPRLRIDGGTMRIFGLFERDQNSTINLKMDGGLAGFLHLLAAPRLHLLSKHPISFTNPSGRIQAEVTLSLPLKAHIRNQDMHVQAHADFQNVYLGNVVLGRAVSDGRGVLDATEKGLSVHGQGVLGGVPTTTQLEESFEAKPAHDIKERIQAVSIFNQESVERAQLGPGGLFDGKAVLTTRYLSRTDDTADIGLKLDLGDAGLVIPVWEKPRGQAAQASAHITMRQGRFVTLDGIEATGPDLSVHGSAEVSNGVVQAMLLRDFRIGRSVGDARIGMPVREGAPIHVTIHARDLDLAPLVHPELAPKHKLVFKKNPANKSALSSKTMDGGWIVDLQAGRLFYSRTNLLGGVKAHLEDIHGSLRQGDFSCVTPSVLHIGLHPRGQKRHLYAQVQDLGAFLTGAQLTDRLSGGLGTMEGTVGDATKGALPAFDGAINVGPFAFRQPPGVLTAASHLSVYGWSQASDKRFKVEHLHLPISVRNDTITIYDGRLGNEALGATLEGKIGLDDGVLRLNGTVVPFFAINAAPGRLPGIGKLFSPEKGGGLLAATFTINGKASQPELKVNPFSMFLPGVLRRLIE
ncbi:AsmA-like C-terminal region-containing protein [Kozakia baliensis]|uniref:AsmA-like C-terminal domain-containing protein n=1 Tax=Kozakia baliensis TaxID=153496 RepID=A0A1D8URI8_9PROT|nr:AsmA-like C-terminal region-containing protein [Kozakia baliensis]AOX16240.1 hypothetical protein A0U89_02905 [Kozakia baliensis]GBR28335.1 hypothetical protein AA0488_1387 [Kozakia baliensis NRIC 0488]GEL63712.1 hypothetical protein KBA01_09980 [Kozakia baliensis]